MTLRLHFSEKDWERIARDWAAWWSGELDRPLVVLECIEPENEHTPHYASTFLGNHPDLSADEALDMFIPRLEATHHLGDAFPRFWPNFGPGVAAAFAGARVHSAPDTMWFSPARAGALADLHVACDWHNPWWRRVAAVTEAAVRRWGKQLSVGFTDLGGNLDILASLRSAQYLLTDLCDEPDEVDRLVRETTRTWLDCYAALSALIQPAGRGFTCWGPCWSPDKGYLLQCDFAYMISPRMFERFVLPYLADCCAALDYAFYHLDGKGQLPHLDLILSLPRLRGIQWVPGDGSPPSEKWLPLLKRIHDSGKLCQIYVTAEGAQTILRELGGSGFLLVIQETLTPQLGFNLLSQIQPRRSNVHP